MCHRSRSYVGYIAREWPRRDDDLRASQAERERVVDRLRAHAGDGRLEIDELEQRIEAAYAARTRGDLRALLRDLPETQRRDTRSVLRPVLAFIAFMPLALAIALFALAPPGLAWIGWPVLGWWLFGGGPAAAFGFAACGPSRRQHRRTVVV
jgi:hypothetical protein